MVPVVLAKDRSTGLTAIYTSGYYRKALWSEEFTPDRLMEVLGRWAPGSMIIKFIDFEPSAAFTSAGGFPTTERLLIERLANCKIHRQ